jgi:hypothetical protein
MKGGGGTEWLKIEEVEDKERFDVVGIDSGGQQQHGSTKFSGGRTKRLRLKLIFGRDAHVAHVYAVSDTGVMCPDRKVG